MEEGDIPTQILTHVAIVLVHAVALAFLRPKDLNAHDIVIHIVTCAVSTAPLVSSCVWFAIATTAATVVAAAHSAVIEVFSTQGHIVAASPDL
jgi:hypothetical protein